MVAELPILKLPRSTDRGGPLLPIGPLVNEIGQELTQLPFWLRSFLDLGKPSLLDPYATGIRDTDVKLARNHLHACLAVGAVDRSTDG